METARREFLKILAAAAAMAGAPALAWPQGASDMYGLMAKLTAAPGKRDELMTILIEGTREMPGCLTYIVAKDASDENTIWVTETWDSQASHDASLTLPAVKSCIAQGKPLIAGFEKIATTNPAGGVGLPVKSSR
jgi:quinol monooxygenase YgiN